MAEPKPVLYWHIHHEVLMEAINEPIEINYIKAQKLDVELRLRLLKPVASPTLIFNAWAEYEKVERPAWAEYEKVVRDLHGKECPNCPWRHMAVQSIQ